MAVQGNIIRKCEAFGIFVLADLCVTADIRQISILKPRYFDNDGGVKQMIKIMFERKFTKLFPYLFVSLVFMPVLVGCGGGGGSSASISYTGLTTQAVITQANGEDIAYSAYQNGSTGNSLGTVLSVEQSSDIMSSRPRMLVLSQALRKSVNQISLAHDLDNQSVGAVVNDSSSIPGDCGGNAVYSISINDVTYEFSGTFTFDTYCIEDTTLSGTIGFSGQFNPDTVAFGQVTMSFDSLTVKSGSDSFSADGDLTIEPGASSTNVTLNMVMLDNSTDKTYMVQNYVMTLTEDLASVTMMISGRLYDPDYGYVDITTPTPLVISNGDAYPSSGVVLATGSEGSSGNPAKAKLTALSSTVYQIEIDEDGDSAFEYLNTGNWADL